MTIIQVDVASSEPIQAFLTGFLNVLRIGSYLSCSIGIKNIRKLRRKENLTAFPGALEPFPDKILNEGWR